MEYILVNLDVVSLLIPGIYIKTCSLPIYYIMYMILINFSVPGAILYGYSLPPIRPGTAIVNMIILDFECVCAGHCNIFLFAVIAGQPDLIAINDDVTTTPDTNTGRSGIVGIVVLDDDVMRIVYVNSGIIVVWTGVYYSQS